MRTTLDIDDDVLSAAKERAAREKISVGQALTGLARAGLAGTGPKPLGRIALLPKRNEIVTLEHVRAISDDEGDCEVPEVCWVERGHRGSSGI